jgi:Abortive infection C-terminus/Protein of unknown function (DUF3085)
MNEETEAPPLEISVALTLSRPKYGALLQQWDNAVERRSEDKDGAITAARTLLESTCKLILDECSINYSTTDDLPKLYSLVSNHLGVSAGSQIDRILKTIFGSVHAIVQSVGELRNKAGDSHGKGKSPLLASRSHAELAVNLAGSVAIFIISTYESYLSATKRLDARGDAILRFDKTLVWRLIDHAKNAPESQKAYAEEGEDAVPALWLVGDSGVYLMSNGKPPILATGEIFRGQVVPGEVRFLMAPAEGCDPGLDDVDAWWPIHNAIDDGNDFVQPIPLAQFDTPLARAKTQIVIIAGREEYSVVSDADYEGLS